MPNTLTGLIPVIYLAIDQVARELVGFIPAVYRNSTAARAAKGQTIRYPVVGAFTAADIVAAATGPDPAAFSVPSEDMTIDKSRSVTFYWEGEEQMGFRSSGLYESTMQQLFVQAMRTICNEVEADLALAAYQGASRAFGTAGTTPFGTNFNEIAELLKILKDNGAPVSELQLVLNTAAGTKLRQLSTLYKANEAGNDTMLRQGVLLDLLGFAIRESAQIKGHVKGTGAGYLVNNAAGEPVGDTEIALDTGAGTILPGDVVTFAADAVNKYVAKAYSAPTVSLNKPGLLTAIPDNNAMTIGNNYTANVAFERSAVHLVTRAPAMPEGGDAADDVREFQDPRSGLAFQVCLYRQRRRVAYEVGLAWGKKTVKSDFVVNLLG